MPAASALTTIMLLGTPGFPAASGLEGTEVTVTAYCCSGPVEADRFTEPATATVGPGIEFPSGSITTTTRQLIPSNIDVSAAAIDLQYTDSNTATVAPFNGYAFDFSGLGTQRIAAVMLDPLSTFPAGSVGLTFDADSVFYNGSGLAFTPTSRVLINVVLAPVPEPSAALLMFAAGLVFACRWRRRGCAAR